MIREQYTNEKDWLEARKRDFGTGGSEAAVILGISPFKTIDQLFDEKMGLVKPKDISGSPAVQRGKALEPLLRADAQYRLKDFL
jgi:Phage-related protein, predicted endonuclease